MSTTEQMPVIAPAVMDWTSPPFFMLRVGGLPVSSVAPLRSEAMLAWADRVLGLERELDLRKAPLGTALEACIGRTDDISLRRQMLALRRDVFNLRPPRDPQAAVRACEELDPASAAALREWLMLRARHADELRDGDRLLGKAVTEGRRQLRALAEDRRLRAGIMLASPSLDRYLSGYTEARADRSLSKRARRIERSLLEYLYRTACKTSPFSTFTAVALGRFQQVPGGPLLEVREGAGPQSFTRLNLATIARLIEDITANPRLRADLPVEITSGWRSDAARVRYVRRQRRIGDSDAAVTVDVLQENLFYLAEGGVVAELLRYLPDGARMRFRSIAEQLRQADAANRDADDVTTYLARLLRLGLLTVPVLHVDIHDPDPVSRFAAGIQGLGSPWASGLADRLGRVTRHVAAFRAAELPGRRQLLDNIQAELVTAQQELGRADPQVPRTLLYEDVTLGDAEVTGNAGAWEREFLPDLRAVCRILPAFDMTLPNRLLTTGFFHARYGHGGHTDDVITFAHEFNQDCFEHFSRNRMRHRPFSADNEFIAQLNWFKMPEIDALDRARLMIAERMRASYSALGPAATELVLDEEFVTEVAGALPDGVSELDPRSFFLQVAEDGDRHLAVVNRVYSGLALLFSRFAHCFPAEGADGLVAGLRRHLAGLQPEGSVFAELTGGYDTTNLNLHPALMPYELVCPGDVSSRPAAEQIPVDDLVIADDLRTGRPQLRSRRLGVNVIPVYLGFLMPFALPEVQRVLLTFSYSNMAMLDLWDGVVADQDPVLRLPRIRLGNVVLQRQQWRVNPGQLPTRLEGMSEAAWFLSWQRWRSENGVPERVFASIGGRAIEDDQEQRGADTEGAPLTKPQHVDFGSYFSLTLLDRVLRSATGRLVLTEMLPDLNQLWLKSGRDRFVTELTLELDGVKRSRV
jgi:hypothetical protein